MHCHRRNVIETKEIKTQHDCEIFSIGVLTPTIGNDRVAEMTGFAFFTVPSNRVAQTVNTFTRHTVTGSFVAVTRLASGTNYQRIPVVRRGTPVERTNCHV